MILNSTTNQYVSANKLSTTDNDKEPAFSPTESATVSKSLVPNFKNLNTFSFLNIQGLHPQSTKSFVPYISDILYTEHQ